MVNFAVYILYINRVTRPVTRAVRRGGLFDAGAHIFFDAGAQYKSI